MLSKELRLVNSTEVHITLANHIEIDSLDKIRTELLSFLRDKLSNDNIDIVAEVSEEEKDRKAYTNSEKFEKLIEKQPLLKELKDRLGLDPNL